MGKYWFDRKTRSQIISDQKYWSLCTQPNSLVVSSDRPYFPDGPISWEVDGLNFNHHHRELPPVSKKIIRDTEDNHSTLVHKGGLQMSKSIMKNGKFCELRRAFWKPARCYVALKIYSKAELSSKVKKDIALELYLLRKFKHMYILAYFGVIETKWKMYHVFEWMCNGNLLEYLKSLTGPLEIEVVQRMFAQLVSAVAFLHDASYVHRDIKLENILVGKKGDIRVTGFRHAVAGFAFNKNSENSSWPKTTNVVGAKLYMSPEALIEIPYNAMLNDVWAMGVILFTMLFRKFPFPNTSREECATLIRTGFCQPAGRYCPPDAKEVLVAIFAHESKRIRSYQLGDMAFLVGQRASQTHKEIKVEAKDAMKELNKTINASPALPKNNNVGEQDLKPNDVARLKDEEIKEKYALLCKAQSRYDLFSHVRPDFYFNIPPQLLEDFAMVGNNIEESRIIRMKETKKKVSDAKHLKVGIDSAVPPMLSNFIQPSTIVHNEEPQNEKNISTLYSKSDFDQKLISQVPSIIP